MSKSATTTSATIRIVLAIMFCIFATRIIREGLLEPIGIDERIAITLVWVVGVAWMIWTAAKKTS